MARLAERIMAGKKKKAKDLSNSIARNKRARFEYFIEENFEAGIALAEQPS